MTCLTTTTYTTLCSRCHPAWHRRHPSGSRQRHPRYTGAVTTGGRGWLDTNDTNVKSRCNDASSKHSKNTSLQTHSGKTNNGSRHQVRPLPGGNGKNPGGLLEDAQKVNGRGCMQKFTIDRGNPLLTVLWRKPQKMAFKNSIYFCYS